MNDYVIIGENVKIDKTTEVLPFTYIGKVPGFKTLARKCDFKKTITVGKNCRIGPFVTIYYDVKIGDNCLVNEGASIREQCRIGNGCILGRNVTMLYDIVVGDGTRILEGSHITGHTEIGKNVFISVNISTTNDRSFNTISYDDKKMRGPVIEDDVKIGAGSNILPNVRIGRGSIVSAGSVVRRDVPADSVVAGNPAKIVGKASKLLEMMKSFI